LLVTAEGQRPRPLPAAVSVEAGAAVRPFTVQGYLDALGREVEVVPWPAGVEAAAVTFLAAGPRQAGPAPAAARPEALQPWQASRLVLEAAGLDKAGPVLRAAERGPADGGPVAIQEADRPFFAAEGGAGRVLAVLAAEADGALRPTAEAVVQAARLAAQAAASAGEAGVLVLVPDDRRAQQETAAELAALAPLPAVLVPVAAGAPEEVRARLLAELWPRLGVAPPAVVGEPWAEPALVALGGRALGRDRVLTRVQDLDRREGRLAAETSRLGGKVRCRQPVALRPGATCWLTLAADARVGAVSPPDGKGFRVQRWSPPLERFYGRDDVRRLLQELKQEAGVTRLGDAEFIIDVGFGVGNRDGYEAVIEPLEKALQERGVRGLAVGGSRKVTEELHLLPPDRQIGQSGVSVRPKVLLAVGISGAPQHLNYIGPGATIVAFNRDPEAPLMTLNRRQPAPRVFPVVGDLFETVPAFTAALAEEPPAEPSWPHHEITDGV
jgi:electron transfer flavoprotein alpha subunit